MHELAAVAKDLEMYNKNRYFNDRARSMLVGTKGGASDNAGSHLIAQHDGKSTADHSINMINLAN